MDPKAAKSVLEMQMAGQKSLKVLQFITTEAGKAIMCTVDGLSKVPDPSPRGQNKSPKPLQSWPLGLRALAYGIESKKSDPVKHLLGYHEEHEKKQFFSTRGKTPVGSPDVIAFLAAYSKKFSDKYRCRSASYPHTPSGVYNGVPSGGDKSRDWRVTFCNTKEGENIKPTKGSIDVWMPNIDVTVKGFKANEVVSTGELMSYIEDCDPWRE